MNHVLPIINGKTLLGDLDDDNVISESAYSAISAINEVITTEKQWDDEIYFYAAGQHSHQVLEYSMKTLIDHEPVALVKAVVEKFGIKTQFSDDFATMIDNLKD
jgi:hypothetical protein